MYRRRRKAQRGAQQALAQCRTVRGPAALLRAAHHPHDAAAAGADIAVVTTQPGSKSQQNAQRQGFSLLYTRAMLIKRFDNA